MILKYPLQTARKCNGLIQKIRTRTLFNDKNRKIVPYKEYHGYVEFADEQANSLIKTELSHDKPLMICKFGTTEMGCIRNYLSIREPKRISDAWKYIKKEKKSLWWWEWADHMHRQSGFFPATEENMERFCELMFDDIKEIDILCSYMKHEDLIKERLAHTKKINTEGLAAPYFYERPWTELLKGKKVLVVHPFEESIQKQFKKRELLFENPNVLPEFELSTIKAVQTVCGNFSDEFKDWFEALDYMKDRITKTDFDIALIGCGAYGLPLAAHVKRLGKKGIHMASYTQLLFGIYGKRWTEIDEYAALINEHWTRPLQSEVPANHTKLEGGAYW